MAAWCPPEGVAGDSAVIKVSVGMLGPARYRCPARDAMSARRNLSPTVAAPRKREVLEQFTNGPFMAAMDLIEHADRSVQDALCELDARVACNTARPFHDGLRQWTAHALAMYGQAFSEDGGQPMLAVRRQWTYRSHLAAPDKRGATTYEITVWGRCYRSADGATRELRLVANHLRGRARTDTEVAVAAFVLAAGGPGPVPQRVRVVRCGLLEGRAETLFDGTREAADELYRHHGQEALGDLVEGQEFRPGSACADCSYAPVCPALPRQPGLLGLDDRSRPRRTWSATNGRAYRACPAREHLRRHHLPVDLTVERSAAAERGRAVHSYLERRHEARPRTPCVPHIPGNWTADQYKLPMADRDLGARLLRHHAEVCPLRQTHGDDDLQVEPDLVFDDPAADVVVLAKPDLLYRDHGVWVWRETKTSARDRSWSSDPLTDYPQLALAVELVGRGALGGGRGRVELEVLRPRGVDLMTFDPFTAGTRAAARQVLALQLQRWHTDDEFAASPGVECASCEVARWCSARVPVAGNVA